MAKTPAKKKPVAKAKPAAKKKPVAKMKPAAKAKPAAMLPPVDELLAQYWERPDPATLRVWADSLLERGDPRGEYIQMCLLEAPTDEQRAIRKAYDDKHHTKLVGPAQKFLRQFELGANGLVERARCEADLLIAGLPHIEWLNPHLALSVTSVDAKGAGLEHISLERIYHVNFAWGVIGSQSGSNMKTATLTRIAPSLRRVRHLSLQCTGYADKCFAPEALRAVGESVECLEYLGFHYHNSGTSVYRDPKRLPLEPLEAYANVIATTKGFRTLKAIFIRGLADPGPLYGLPNVKHVETLGHRQPGSWRNHASTYSADYGLPATFEELDPLTRS